MLGGGPVGTGERVTGEECRDDLSSGESGGVV